MRRVGTATIEEAATCLEAAYECRKAIDKICADFIRESSRYRALASYVQEAGDYTGLDEGNVAMIRAMTGEAVELVAEWRV